MARPDKFTPEEIIKAIEDGHGILSSAAQILKCSRTTVDKYRRKYEKVRKAIIDSKESMKDFVEQQLYKNIVDQKEASIFFYLKTQAKDRGYEETSQQNNFNVDMSKLTNEQLKRVANGESIQSVLS
jgi:DNA-directed RNA polymerase specialized sigma54-like protein